MARSERRGLWWRVLPLVLAGPARRRPDRGHAPRLRGEAARRACRSQPARSGGAFHPVAGGFVADATALADCAGSYSCLEQAFGNIAFERGPKRALAVFETELVRDKDVERDCHRIVHTIGSATYARYDGDVARTFARGLARRARPATTTGSSSARSSGSTSKAELARGRARSSAWASGFAGESFLDYQCRHGLGHGFMIQTGYDLPTALSLCSGLGHGLGPRHLHERFVHGERQHAVRLPVVRGSTRRIRCTRAIAWRRSIGAPATCAPPRGSCRSRRTTSGEPRIAVSPRVAGRAVCFRGFGRDAVVEGALPRLPQGPRAVRPRPAGTRATATSAPPGRSATARALAGAPARSSLLRRGSRGARGRSCAGGYGIVRRPRLRVARGAPPRLRARLNRRSYANACAASAEDEVDPSGRNAWG